MLVIYSFRPSPKEFVTWKSLCTCKCCEIYSSVITRVYLTQLEQLMFHLYYHWMRRFALVRHHTSWFKMNCRILPHASILNRPTNFYWIPPLGSYSLKRRHPTFIVIPIINLTRVYNWNSYTNRYLFSSANFYLGRHPQLDHWLSAFVEQTLQCFTACWYRWLTKNSITTFY